MLDIVPGHASMPETGEPIAVVTLAHEGEVEQPTMKDVRRIAIDMIAVLAHHGDSHAQDILEQHFRPKKRRLCQSN